MLLCESGRLKLQNYEQRSNLSRCVCNLDNAVPNIYILSMKDTNKWYHCPETYFQYYNWNYVFIWSMCCGNPRNTLKCPRHGFYSWHKHLLRVIVKRLKKTHFLCDICIWTISLKYRCRYCVYIPLTVTKQLVVFIWPLFKPMR